MIGRFRKSRAKTKAKPPRSAAPRLDLESYTPPEGVPISLELASIGARLGAVFLDLLISWISIGLIVLFVLWTNILPYSAIAALVILLGFLVGIPYYVLAELIWHGRTLGKRIVGIRVVSVDGRALGPHQIVARNLLKQAEFFAPLGLMTSVEEAQWPIVLLGVIWTIVVGVIPLRSKRKQRLGDMIAGTIVIVKPKAALLQDLAMTAPQARFVFDQAQLDIYGKFELQTLETILREKTVSPALQAEMKSVAATIAKRINFVDPAVAADPHGFLTAFYRAQRERLESRQLFGDRREDKFHDAAKAP